MNGSCILLNGDYSFLCLVDWKKAMGLMFTAGMFHWPCGCMALEIDKTGPWPAWWDLSLPGLILSG